MKTRIFAVMMLAILAVGASAYSLNRPAKSPVDVFEVFDVPQRDVWENVKYAKGEGFELFTFSFTKDGNVNIKAVRGFVNPAP